MRSFSDVENFFERYIPVADYIYDVPLDETDERKRLIDGWNIFDTNEFKQFPHPAGAARERIA